MRRSHGRVPWVRALRLFMFKEDPLKLYNVKFATELIKWFLNGRLVNMMFLPEIYIEKEQIAGAKKWPSHAEISWTHYLS
jgi:phosphorylcholine metabolism protein LicD